MIEDLDTEAARRAMEAVLKMGKLDVAELRRAFERTGERILSSIQPTRTGRLLPCAGRMARYCARLGTDGERRARRPWPSGYATEEACGRS